MAVPDSQQSKHKAREAGVWLQQGERAMARWMARWIMWLNSTAEILRYCEKRKKGENKIKSFEQ